MVTGFNRILRYSHWILVIVILVLVAIQIITGGTLLTIFLSTSILLVVYSAINLLYCQINYADPRIGSWRNYAIFLLGAMVFGFLGDVLMPGLVLFPTGMPLLNGIIFFGIGHGFYLFALQNRSPLLLRSQNQRRVLWTNVLIWVLSIIFVLLAFQITVYDPSNPVLSIGALGYGIVLVTVLAFAITKWFDEYPLIYKLAIIFGFLLFFISDWVIAIRNFRDSNFLAGTAFIGTSYSIGQLLIQSSTLFGFTRIPVEES